MRRQGIVPRAPSAAIVPADRDALRRRAARAHQHTTPSRHVRSNRFDLILRERAGRDCCAPVHVIPCIAVDQLAVDPPRHVWAGLMGSILPAVWSFQLALRARGLGSTFTTLHLRRGDEAAELLGIPANIMQVGLLPVAYTIGTDFKPAQRPPLEDITHWEQW